MLAGAGRSTAAGPSEVGAEQKAGQGDRGLRGPGGGAHIRLGRPLGWISELLQRAGSAAYWWAPSIGVGTHHRPSVGVPIGSPERLAEQQPLLAEPPPSISKKEEGRNDKKDI